MSINNDVSLDELLNNALKDDTEVSAAGASAGVDTNEQGNGEIEPESNRANTRIRELVTENKNLKGDNLPYNSTDEFLDAVEDEGSRNLLKTFATLQRRELDNKLDPFTKERRESEFDSKFNAISAKIPGIEAFKNELKTTYSRSSNTTPEQLIGKLLVDRLTDVKPKTESRSASVGRAGVPNIGELSKEGLYALLASSR